MSQYYVTEAENEYVILGNSAIMKCKIPSFVADFVQVDAWIADDGKTLKHGDEDHGSAYISKEQPIELYFERTFDIYSFSLPPLLQDTILLVALHLQFIPPFGLGTPSSCGRRFLSWRKSFDGLCLVVVSQSYEVEADNEYVIRGNSAVMKCEVPSFVSDFVIVEHWQDSQGNTYLPEPTNYGTR